MSTNLQDIELHIKPMPKQVPFVPDLVTKVISNAVMFTVSSLQSSHMFCLDCNIHQSEQHQHSPKGLTFSVIAKNARLIAGCIP